MVVVIIIIDASTHFSYIGITALSNGILNPVRERHRPRSGAQLGPVSLRPGRPD